MSQHAALCHAAFCTPPLSSDAQLKLFAVPNLDWAVLWNFFLKHQVQFLAVLEEALKLLPGGAEWVDLLKIIEDLLAKLNPATP